MPPVGATAEAVSTLRVLGSGNICSRQLLFNEVVRAPHAGVTALTYPSQFRCLPFVYPAPDNAAIAYSAMFRLLPTSNMAGLSRT